jgi:DNA gyrase subunit B
LLTFFYRQMPELIERGHIYIAQPPLYKVRKGKQEQYLKDDAELDAYLLNSALENAALYVNAEAPPIRGPALENLARKFVEVEAIIRRWALRYNARILHQLLYMPPVTEEHMEDSEWLSNWAQRLQELMETDDSDTERFAVRWVAGEPGESGAIEVAITSHGVTANKLIQMEFFRAPEYRRIAELGAEMGELIGDGAYVQRGERRLDVGGFEEAMVWLMEQARRGLHIQRYKGLGEMNPDQLWDTTINPDSRRLMQVRIEDAVAADEIFSTLMGDQVEPRREFIERNALTVANLDI